MRAEAKIASAPSPSTPEEILGVDGGRAYRHFIAWTVGQGFDLAVLEVSDPRQTNALIAWTEAESAGAKIVNLDEVGERPLQTFLGVVCPAPGTTSVLLFRRGEQARNRVALFARLNVQRDELARAFPVPWVLLIHPVAALEMLRHAPDLSDFAGLWLKEEVAATAMGREGTLPLLVRQETMPALSPPTVRTGRSGLVAASEALWKGRYDEARDRLAQYDLHHPEALTDDPLRIELSGLLAFNEGRLSQAQTAFEQALALSRKQGQSEDQIELRIELGQVRIALGDLGAARAVLEEALAMIGEAETSTRATALHELARVLQAQGDLPAAKASLERSLRISAKVFGTDEHPNVAASLHELARVQQAQGDLPAAKASLERCLRIKAKVFGTDEHPDVATSLHELACVLQAQGDLPAAKEKLERVLAIQERVYGTRGHYSTAITEASLALLLRQLGEGQRVAELLKHAHATCLAQLGPNHPTTLQLAELVAQK
ncbi:MAG: tetratricopeptide repeat protein [Minicystis sp.]